MLVRSFVRRFPSIVSSTAQNKNSTLDYITIAITNPNSPNALPAARRFPASLVPDAAVAPGGTAVVEAPDTTAFLVVVVKLPGAAVAVDFTVVDATESAEV